MAGDWIKIRHDLPDDPAVLAMANELKLTADAVVGKLVRFWIWCDKHTTDGNVQCVTPALLKSVTGMQKFAAALRKVGWLDTVNGHIVVPNYERHMGKSAKKRAENARRQAEFKSRKSNTTALPKALPEKRREEKSNIPPIVPLEGDVTAKDIYQAYPKKTHHKAAIRAIHAALDVIEAGDLLRRVREFAQAVELKRGTDAWKFIPGPAAWFRGQRWKDEPDPPPKPNPYLKGPAR